MNEGRSVSAPSSVTASPPVCAHWNVSGSSSGSELPEPSNSTRSPASTCRSSPASAVGIRLLTDTVTSSGSLSVFPSFTTREKFSAPGASGAMNEGRSVSAPSSVTSSPPVCVHRNVSSSPFGSELPEPSSSTRSPGSASRSSPASAVGEPSVGSGSGSPPPGGVSLVTSSSKFGTSLKVGVGDPSEIRSGLAPFV